ncbi:glycosyltransferase [Rhodococcus sp. PAMC28707]|uniref:glycosyltransferase n=1 Tax=unclassified Rhodococcus (in: high G+C Gram-positive bacteria) TaxID=192944 RepID=UPI00109DF57B|nr:MULTISPECIES: glycosyltransferase [unclassified Rhodococcus (in: high G+C Gram-positive bacteria)]QCB49756.1 glycosyltransferase [Rhodococcus sp. PAMC28705]QCB58551.1 glycosyltransferase [Rhodococcus sp. PAMC28707]
MKNCSTHIRQIVVVVPVHNEEDLLQQALSSLARSRASVEDVEVRTIVVLDACSDNSAKIAAEWAARTDESSVISVDFRNVGSARAAGFRAAEGHAELSGTNLHETWYATTDADSTCRPDWLASHLRHAQRGAQAVAGTVRVDLDSAPAGLERAYRAGYRNQLGHRHVHGANLALRADVYRAVGGFRSLPTGEDVDLIHRVEGSSIPVLYACDSPVSTSNRRDGRAPEGFAGHLRNLEAAMTQ